MRNNAFNYGDICTIMITSLGVSDMPLTSSYTCINTSHGCFRSIWAISTALGVTEPLMSRLSTTRCICSYVIMGQYIGYL